MSMAASAPWPDWIMSYHLRPSGSARISGFPAEQVGEEAHIVGMVGDDEEIERPRQLRRLTRRRHDLLASGEAIGIARSEPCAERAGIHRKGRVQMRIAEEGPRSGNCARRRASRVASSWKSFGSVVVECAHVGVRRLLPARRHATRHVESAIVRQMPPSRMCRPSCSPRLKARCSSDYARRKHQSCGSIASSRSTLQNAATVPIP